MPFEQKVTFGFKSFVGFNYFSQSTSSVFTNSVTDLKPLLGLGLIGNYKVHHNFSFRNELLLSYNRYLNKNVNYSTSFCFLGNYHFKHHAFITFGMQPSVVVFENNYIDNLGKSQSGVTTAFEIAGVIGAEYPINDNLDLGIRIVKSFNNVFQTELPDYQGLVLSFSYYWHRYTSSERKFMDHKKKKLKNSGE